MTNQERITELNQQITSAIYEFEEAARKLSRLEEKMAKLTAPNSSEGRIARRGALRTAILGRDENRAEELFQRYTTEENTDEQLATELKSIFEQETAKVKAKKKIRVDIEDNRGVVLTEGLPVGTEIRVRRPDCNYDHFICIFEVVGENPNLIDYKCQKIECQACDGTGKDYEDENAPCAFCNGTGFAKEQ